MNIESFAYPFYAGALLLAFYYINDPRATLYILIITMIVALIFEYMKYRRSLLPKNDPKYQPYDRRWVVPILIMSLLYGVVSLFNEFRVPFLGDAFNATM